MTTVTAADNRRATTLVCHYGHDNLEGVTAVLQETVEANRVTKLIISILDLHRGITPILLTQDGLACLTQMIYSAADETTQDQDCRRAARLIICHNERDTDGINTVLNEAADAERVSELLVGLLSLFSNFLPILYSQLGLEVLQRIILDWAARETTE